METLTTPSLPLQRYRLFESHDMDEARESVARVFCPHGLVMLKPRTELDACHHSARLHRDVSLNYVQYGPGVQIDPGYLQEFFLLQIPLRGGAEIRCGAQQVDATPLLASLPSPTEPLSMRWADDSPHLIVQLARSALLSRLESLLQAPVGQALVFDLGVPLDNPVLAPLVHFIDYLRLTLDAGNALQAGSPLAEHAEAYLMSSLLMSAGHNYSRVLAGDAQRRLLPRVVRRAQEYMAAHAEEPLSLADVCREVGCSARALQLAFRQHAGQGPMEFLREMRLDRVRAELRSSAGVAGTGVREVAQKYGFLHLGHFAAQYRARFGERPSETRGPRGA
ncbi:AraC-like DNA-binding protein [Variovorax boronicumulans]|uniref:AraC family transcriptional regulator n=1 Tax=Variovorax TaxID=34072 RepID=UPI0027850D44|nr:MULTISPECIES: AraC family transcriptional regulator [Variovorax]MDQ0033629.1 AraC-like DNA-binding protein [Variovorax boronicumulans]MDQ0043700.1 AraC-like DNA-binding protein [Variovorax boronicumulans]MDQ0606367.1 AraC-like DNA-binding protein [Variovorax sp. W1I1]